VVEWQAEDARTWAETRYEIMAPRGDSSIAGHQVDDSTDRQTGRPAARAGHHSTPA
jgi:hypothetical protein